MSVLSTSQAGKSVITHELTVLFEPDIAAGLPQAIEAVILAAERAGFTVYSMDIEGKKTLAYPIQGKEQSIYANFNLGGNGSPSALVDALEDDRVLRYLLVAVKK